MAAALESAWQVRPLLVRRLTLQHHLSPLMHVSECRLQVLTANFSEFQLATVFTFLIHETAFFLSGLPSLLFERFGLFAKYKIQVRWLGPV